MAKGYIYIFFNPSFPEYIKIGYADDIEKRLKQLNRSETIPYAFRAYARYEVNERLTDIELHKLIDKLNPDLRAIDNFTGKKRVKEFYAMSKEDGYNILESIAKISGTMDRLKKISPNGHDILEEKQAEEIRESARRRPFSFTECSIPVGSELEFVADPNIKVTVVDDRHIKYGDETTSLSGLAKQLKGYNHPVQGTLWFKYNGEILDDLRRRLEKCQ